MIVGASGFLLAAGGVWVLAQETETLPQREAAKPAAGGEASGKASLADKYSYAIGLEMGNSFRSREMQLSAESVAAGIRDGLSGAEPRFVEEARFEAMQQMQMMMSNKEMAQQRAAGAKNEQAGKSFLAKNKAREGVKVTKSGLQYRIVQPGTGATPGLNDSVKCNYKGTLINGTVFDASAKHGGPATFPVAGVIPGWTEALQLMKVGAKWQLYIPADLAYGNRPPGPPIEAGSTLVFDIELLGIE